MRLPLIVFAPFAAAALALIVGRWTGRRTGWLMVLSALTSFSATISLMVSGGGEHQAAAGYAYEWIPGLTIHFNLLADPFGLFFAALVSGIGTLVGVYSLHYIPELPNARVGRYYAALIAFMGAMLGVSLADDLILLFVFWEVTSITSFMLIGFWYEDEKAKKGALTALQVTGLGGLAMMAGFIIVGNVTGTFSISELRESPLLIAKLVTSPLFDAALILVFLGAFTKSAQFPFHFWLPNAMVAPTPVSTYLHSATMVKAGIFLVGRMLPIFSENAMWSPVLITIGLFTFVYTAYQAFSETDLKAILARTTLSTLGLVMFVYGLKAADQDVLQILNHAAYKGTLFLIVGIVEHATHTRDVRELGGLRKRMPITFIIAVLACLSMAGIPPFLGFLAKETLYAQLVYGDTFAGRPDLQWFVIGAAVLANAFIFAVALKIIFGVFCGKETEKAHHAHEAEKGLWVPAACLVAFAVIFGLLGVTHITENVMNGLSSNLNHEVHAHISLIPSHLPPVILTIITISIGILIYQNQNGVERVQNAVKRIIPMAQKVWDEILHGVANAATWYSDRWQSGSLRWYLGGILVFAAGLTLWALYWSGVQLSNVAIDLDDVPWYAICLLVLLAAAGITVAVSRSRLQAAVAVTATGFLTSLIFVVYQSPDILLTQILIETVSTIFVLLILYFMPAWKREPLNPFSKLVNFSIAAAVGFSMFLYVLFATSDKYRTTDNLGSDFLSAALPGAGGENAVNVIIVDFRAGDTSGEITVLVLVAILVYGLLRSRRKGKPATRELTPALDAPEA
ncbi:MAG: hydrogen gas-evolving membrane-bound hydrogenase subunit E [Phycisphaeraceae bacterium]